MDYKKMIKFGAPIALSSLILFGCSNDASEKEVDNASAETEDQQEVATEKASLELVKEIKLADVAEDQVPDLAEDGWSKGINFSKPVMLPNGKNTLIVTESEMTLYDTASGEQVWSKPTYGGIEKYAATNDYIYLSEKSSSKKFAETSYIYSIDVKTGEEVWKYDLQQDIGPHRTANMPEGSEAGSTGFINIQLEGDTLYAKVSDSWKSGEVTDRVEILAAFDTEGNKKWTVESVGYPGLFSTGEMTFVDDQIVLGSYSYGEALNGPAYIQSFDKNTGELLWKYDIPWEEEFAYSESNNISVTTVGDKIVGTTSFGRVYVLDQKGTKINDFLAWEPVQAGEETVTTYVLGGKVRGFGEDGLVIAPSKTVLKGASTSEKTSIEHPDANSVLVFNLDGEPQWKFRLGAAPLTMNVKDNYLLLGTASDRNTESTDSSGVYVFDLNQKGEGLELNVNDQSVVDQYLGFYRTDGIIYTSMIDSSDGHTNIAAISWPTRFGTEKVGSHTAYLLKLD